MNDIVEIMASLAECYIVTRFCNRFSGFKDKRLWLLKSAVFFLLLAADNVLLSQLDGFETVSVAVLMILIFVYSALFLNGKIYEKAFVAIIPAITALPINLIVVNAFAALSGCPTEELTESGGKFRIIVLLFSKLGFFFVCELLIRIRKKGDYSLDGVQWIIQLSCFVLSFLIANSMWRIMGNAENSGDFLFIGILIAALNVLLYILLNKMRRDSVIREEYRLSQINLAAQEQLVTEARERYTEMRTLRHDMRHCLTAAAELIKQGKNDEANGYIEKVLNEKLNTSAVSVNTGSAVIDAVINSRLTVCAKDNIRVKCLVDTTIGNISEIDLSILISNMLENAVRGCENAENPEIELVISNKKSFLYIMVKNSIPASVLSGNPDLRTSKDDKSAHGFGIKSIRKLAEKYNGSAEFKEENGCFIVEIWLSSAK